jgi:hypothetical protein
MASRIRRRSSLLAAGYVTALQAGGHRFDPGTLHYENRSKQTWVAIAIAAYGALSTALCSPSLQEPSRPHVPDSRLPDVHVFVRTCVRLTSRGHPYAVFRRALDRGNPTAALAAAADLPHVGLVDALELCLLLRDDGARFDRAIIRWHARYATETSGVTVEEAQAVLALLAALRGARGAVAARSLAELVYRRGLERASEVLIRWADEADRRLASAGIA